jgi:MFS family permease
MNGSGEKRLFWACFIALIATAFGFIIRALIMDDWAKQFGLSETQKGEIFGVGLWPFAISIVLFSLIIDKIGYGRAMMFAFLCHAISIAVTVCTPYVMPAAGASSEELIQGRNRAFWMLYVGNFIVALGNGTVEAVINPVVATMFSRDKTKWLNILHAGWPGGLVLGGILTLALGRDVIGQDIGWQVKVGLLAIPVVLYGLLMLGCTFPVSERVAAGVPFRDMLKEVGLLGALVVTALITFEVTNVLEKTKLIFEDASWKEIAYTLNLPLASIGLEKFDITKALAVKLGIIGGVSLLFGLYTLSLGRFIFFFLLVIMMPLAITELGTDSWITDLMGPEMKKFVKLENGGGLVLVYTSFIMMVLRFCAGPIVHRLSPLGLLALSSAIAAAGLFSLSYATGWVILVAATLYGFGKTFFWPTMLGVVSEQFPKGGALTLNTISGVGMMAVGILGNPLLGNIQDKETDLQLKEKYPAIHAEVMGGAKTSVFGSYQPIDPDKEKLLTEEQRQQLTETREGSKKSALKTVALFPIFMFACYVLLILYFAARGGYRPVEIEEARHY